MWWKIISPHIILITPLGFFIFYFYFYFLWLKNIVISNYNKFSKLTLTPKIEEPLSTRVSTCSEASYYYYFVIACQNSKPRRNRHFFFNQVPHFEHCSLKKICVDRVNRNFLWGSLETTRKIHWVGSQKVTKSKEEGGLGLQEAKGRNTALLA